MAKVLVRLAKGSVSRRAAVDIEMAQARQDSDGCPQSLALGRAGRAESQTRELARDVKTLVGWPRRAVAGRVRVARTPRDV